MSLSSHTPSQEQPAKLPQLKVSAIPSVPAPEKKPEPAEKASPAAKPAQAAPAAAQPQKSKWKAIVPDVLLVSMVVGVLACNAFYLKSKWEEYRVPSRLELTNNECLELCARREALQDAYNHADEQLHMRSQLISFDDRLSGLKQQAEALNESIADEQKRVLALQHEIRRTDKEYRSIARGMLPGLPVGDVTTTKGKTYTNATISRIQGQKISLSMPYGSASLPLSDLVKDKLPDIALYALGLIDLVDMSDFTATGAAPTTPTTKSKKLRTTLRTRQKDNYEPASAAPVVDTQVTKPEPDAAAEPVYPRVPADDVWQAPTGELPL